MERHDGRSPGFKMKVTGMFGSGATKRQVRESVNDPANTGGGPDTDGKSGDKLSRHGFSSLCP